MPIREKRRRGNDGLACVYIFPLCIVLCVCRLVDDAFIPWSCCWSITKMFTKLADTSTWLGSLNCCHLISVFINKFHLFFRHVVESVVHSSILYHWYYYYSTKKEGICTSFLCDLFPVREDRGVPQWPCLLRGRSTPPSCIFALFGNESPRPFYSLKYDVAMQCTIFPSCQVTCTTTCHVSLVGDTTHDASKTLARKHYRHIRFTLFPVRCEDYVYAAPFDVLRCNCAETNTMCTCTPSRTKV